MGYVTVIVGMFFGIWILDNYDITFVEGGLIAFPFIGLYLWILYKLAGIISGICNDPSDNSR